MATRQLLANMSFKQNGKKTISVEIIESIIDELRRERKIKMVLAEEDIEDYIRIDLKAALAQPVESLEPHVRAVVEAKQKSQYELCQRLAYLRLGYMLTVLRKIHPQRAGMLSAESFRTKIVKLEAEERKMDKRAGMDRKSAFAKQAAGTTSLGEVGNIRVSAVKRTTDELLLSVTEYVDKLITFIKRDGQLWINRVIDMYRTHLGMNEDAANFAIISQSSSERVSIKSKGLH